MIYLASSSPRRAELLNQLQIAFQVVSAEINEEPKVNETPLNYVKRMALEKARAGAERAPQKSWTLGGDTIGVLDKVILGKPLNREHAAAMLASLSGKSHAILSSVALVNAGTELLAVSTSIVKFKNVDPQDIQAYVDSGEADDKAGAYGIQGKGAVFIESLSGSYSGVMGLPLFETGELLSKAGLDIWRPQGDSEQTI